MSADAGLDLAVDRLVGPFWYRLLVGHLPLDRTDVGAHVDQLLHGLALADTGR